MNKINLNTYVSNIADVKIFDSVNTIIIDNHPKVVKSRRRHVTFSKNIELYQSSTKTRMSAKMEKYGNEPTAAEKFTEEFIHRLSVFNGLSFSKLKLLPSLKILKLYYPLMSQLINTHYELFNKRYKFIYTKHTFIRPEKLFKIHAFIIEYTDLTSKFDVIRRFLLKYCLKSK